MNIEQGTFTPLVYTFNGNVGPEGTLFYKHLCSKIANKTSENLTDVVNWVRCKISFLCLKTSLMCLRGTRISKKDMQVDYIPDDFGYDINEAHFRT